MATTIYNGVGPNAKIQLNNILRGERRARHRGCAAERLNLFQTGTGSQPDQPQGHHVLYGVFFPLLLSPESKPFTLVVLMVHVSVISLLYQSCLVIIGNAVTGRMDRWPRARRIAVRLAAGN